MNEIICIQMMADSIFTVYYDNEFHKMKLYDNCFIASEHDSAHYDQIKGKLMTAYLDSGEISKVHIELNAETLYYLTETDKDTLGNEFKTISGLNRIDCNEIFIYFENSDIQNIAFVEQPTATYYPEDQIPLKDMFLKGFIWRIALRPVSIYGED